MASLTASQLKVLIMKSSKLYGYTLDSDALKYLVEVLVDLNSAERKEAEEQIWSSLAKQKCDVGMITRAQCEQAVLECTGQGKDGSVKLFDVISAFNIPRYTYHKERQKFVKSESCLLPENSDDYANYYRNRYNCAYQRLLRSPLFSQKSSHTTANTANKYKLKSLESLFGSNVLHENITVFGMITQLKPNVWYLEDLSSSIQLDLSVTEYRSGLICDNTLVLCEGNYDNEVLHVVGMSLPPPEEVSITRAQFGDTNFFGGDLMTCAAANKTLRLKEREKPDAFIVFLSHVHLDSPDVMKKLDTLFMGYSLNPPVAFVMCGPFLSPKIHADPHATLSDDIGSLSVFPRPPLPKSVTTAFSRQVKLSEFTTNPCRIQYCSKEIVVFREDLIPKMFRCRVNSPKQDLPNHFARTLISSGSLSVLPLSAMPVFWTYEHAMSLYPLPDLIIAADSYYPYTESYSSSTVVNPGSFPGSKFSFKVYYPATGEVEDSEIPAD